MAKRWLVGVVRKTLHTVERVRKRVSGGTEGREDGILDFGDSTGSIRFRVLEGERVRGGRHGRNLSGVHEGGG